MLSILFAVCCSLGSSRLLVFLSENYEIPSLKLFVIELIKIHAIMSDEMSTVVFLDNVNERATDVSV